MQSFQKINVTDFNLSRIQDNVAKFLNALVRNELLDGVLVESVNLTTSDTQVSHTLGRNYRGYIVTDRNANAVVYTSTTTNNSSDKFLILRASSSCTVDLWVF